MNEFAAVAIITILAVISPGADFAMVTRNSYQLGRGAGLLSALGVGLGVQVHVFYTIFGVAVLVQHTPALFMVMKIIGAGYLVYIGLKSIFSHPVAAANEATESGREAAAVSLRAAFRTGFLTNALNPKTMLFVVSCYTQVMHANTSLGTSLLLGGFMSFAHWVWFSLVALFFSSPRLRALMLQRQYILNRAIGSALVGLGFSLLFSGVGR
ncbi:LysE family translocator [Amantichitinum ursilacus]|uniref:Leucine efflux protein n=1 Tax=Amantichitinum ursilacus TaxID=857265 RepID=A0A0N1JTJ5_9NEIS|nr:LysE family transporter [Amantichitinum ursilacus]KPC54476.1 Leucine efflux protein [Amantichitinum ursilacus]